MIPWPSLPSLADEGGLSFIRCAQGLALAAALAGNAGASLHSQAGTLPHGEIGAVSRHPQRADGESAAALSIPAPRLATTSTAPQLYSHGNPTAAEQYLLELVNRARAHPDAEAARFGIDLNEGIAPGTIPSAPKPPLAFNPRITDAARSHSTWMLETSTFSHGGANGSSPGDRMAAAGYVFAGRWTWGENIAWRGTTGLLELNPTVAKIHEDLFVDDGIDGRGHRVNLLKDNFREIGIGVISGIFTQAGVGYSSAMVTQDFGTTGAQPASFLVGVAFHDANGNGFYDPLEGLAGVTVTPSPTEFAAITSDSGGFAVPLSATAGTLVVTFSGGTLAGPITKSVTLTGNNVKLDLNTAVGRPAITLKNPRFLPDGSFTFGLSGSPGSSVTIQSSDNLADWTDRQALVIGAASTFSDSLATAAPHRFYRAVQR